MPEESKPDGTQVKDTQGGCEPDGALKEPGSGSARDDDTREESGESECL